ncbi:hypothetical protein H0A36_11945 [Endozoicomonas sp. SM1973]|uniref:Uncharacterized protein n=1 Tax=Spartinivicinus marinus TaxID=2994442 RepID=A0A853HZW5_9GAMM|nr:hypothetical protein [Spartinivicinus marinus]MCX4026933.1 hypothetical protein [Spartinivicinus marinus]NYZ66723.1 hypothetical protein [Spartinivicinus marinus]
MSYTIEILKRIVLYLLLIFNWVFFFPLGSTDPNEYKFFDPDTVTPADPDDVLGANIMAFLMVSLSLILYYFSKSIQVKLERKIIRVLALLPIILCILLRLTW